MRDTSGNLATNQRAQIRKIEVDSELVTRGTATSSNGFYSTLTGDLALDSDDPANSVYAHNTRALTNEGGIITVIFNPPIPITNREKAIPTGPAPWMYGTWNQPVIEPTKENK